MHAPYFEQITLPATCAPGHEELPAIVPAKDRKSVESMNVSDPAWMGTGSGVREGRPVPAGIMQGAIRVWPPSGVAVVAVVAVKRSVPASDGSPLYRAVTFAPS